MSYQLGLRFRQVAANLNVLDFANSDYTSKNLLSLAIKYCNRRLNFAQKKRYDLEDPYTLWEILNINAVIYLANIEGKFIRVGINLAEDERDIHNLIYQAKRKINRKLHQALNFDQYWIIKAKFSDFPENKDWIDLLYEEIDKPLENSSYKLIKV